MTFYTSLATLMAGLVLGYLGQRSGFCTISGMRNFYAFRDDYLFNGLLGLSVGALGGYFLFSAIGGDTPDFPLFLVPRYSIGSAIIIVFSAIGGLGLGFFSTLAGGCPFHQHVMAGEGNARAIAYLVGLYAGILFYYIFMFQYVLLSIRLFA